MRGLYNRTLALAKHPKAIWWLGAVAFSESFFFPIPQDVMMIPMLLATPQRAWRIALVATLASAAGGIVGYMIGALLYETVGAAVINLYGYTAEYARFQGWYDQWGAWIVAGGAFTPIPYKVVTIASGAAGMSFPVFLVAALPLRALRFFLLAWLLKLSGPALRQLIERYFGWLTTAAFIIIVAGFAALAWL